MENIVEVKNLTKEYKKLKAIDNLSFEVIKGEILGLLRTEWKWKIYNNKLYIIIIKFPKWKYKNIWQRNETRFLRY